jgi:hypothetical protein
MIFKTNDAQLCVHNKQRFLTEICSHGELSKLTLAIIFHLLDSRREPPVIGTAKIKIDNKSSLNFHRSPRQDRQK